MKVNNDSSAAELKRRIELLDELQATHVRTNSTLIATGNGEAPLLVALRSH